MTEPPKPSVRVQKQLDRFGLSTSHSKAQSKQITSSLRAMIELADQEIDRLDVEWMNLEHIAKKKLEENEPDSKTAPSLSGATVTNKNTSQTNKQTKPTPVKMDIDEFLEELPELNLKVDAPTRSANIDSEEEFDSD